MRYLYIIILIFSSVTVVGQSTKQNENTASIRGKIQDGASKEALSHATIRLLNSTDSTYINGAATDEYGFFRLLTHRGKYILQISAIGYTTNFRDVNLNLESKGIDLGAINLQVEEYMLNEAIIEAKVPDIVVKGDTVVYNASSYTRDESDMLEDIIKNMPGVEIDKDGNITANGKPVKKILVDGKEFFGNDIAMALANLPAGMINNLQLYKEASETSKITGVKDKDPDQVLNLQVKEELKRSAFGNVRLGYGNKDKYNARGIVNYMHNENQASIVGNVDNVSVSDVHSFDNGIDKNKGVGANAYFNSSTKFSLGGNVRYSNNGNEMETLNETETFLSSGNRIAKSTSNVISKRDGIGVGINMKWEIDSMTSIYANSHLYYNETDNRSNSNSISYVAHKDTTSAFATNQTLVKGMNLSNNITIGRKLNSKGRTISLSVNHSMQNNDSEGSNYSLTKYTDGTGDKEIDQRLTTTNRSKNYGISISYVEPLGKDYLLQFSYDYRKNDSKRLRDTRKKDTFGEYTEIDSAYTRNTVNDNINQNIGIDLQANKEKYNYSLGFRIDPSRSTNIISLGDSIIDHTPQRVLNYSPNLHFSYTPNSSTYLNLNYSGNSSQPLITQLSADTTIVSAMYKYYGNPDLKPSYNNHLDFFYQKSNYEDNRFLMLSGGFNYIFNNIVNYTNIDEQGNTTSTYRNMSGDMSANIMFNSNTPLRNKKFTINNSANINYSKNIGFMNAEKNITHNISLYDNLQGRFKSDVFETNINVSINHSIAKNNLDAITNRSTTTFELSNFFLVNLPYDFSIQSNIKYSKYNGYGDDFKSSEILWNAAINKKILKNKKGQLRVQFFDILKDRSNISRYVTSNYISDSRTNTISRYMMFSFNYQFNTIPKEK